MNTACTVEYIDHIGVVVRDMNSALSFFEDVFDIPPAEIQVMPDQGVRVVLLTVGQTRLELLEPLSAESSVGRFLERRGEGLHHLALHVQGISEKLQILADKGLELIDREPRDGASGTIAFVHPRSVHGILTELVQTP